jgi:hypothetical protein
MTTLCEHQNIALQRNDKDKENMSVLLQSHYCTSTIVNMVDPCMNSCNTVMNTLKIP